MPDRDERLVRTFDGSVEVPVRVVGEGPPLLYLHGTFGLVEDEFIDALAENATVYAPSPPGFEGSAGAEFVYENVMEITLHHDDLLTALGLKEPIDVVGHSFGAFLAQEIAAFFPARVRRLALISALGLWLEEAPQPDLFGLTPGTLGRTIFADTESPAARRMFTPPSDREEARLWNRARRRGLIGAAKYLWPLPDKGFARRAYRVRAPSLLLWGAEDAVVPPDPYVDAYRSLLPDATAELIPGAGHMVVEEAPAEAARAVAQPPARSLTARVRELEALERLASADSLRIGLVSDTAHPGGDAQALAAGLHGLPRRGLHPARR